MTTKNFLQKIYDGMYNAYVINFIRKDLDFIPSKLDKEIKRESERLLSNFKELIKIKNIEDLYIYTGNLEEETITKELYFNLHTSIDFHIKDNYFNFELYSLISNDLF